jgi:hypothetical protein
MINTPRKTKRWKLLLEKTVLLQRQVLLVSTRYSSREA